AIAGVGNSGPASTRPAGAHRLCWRAGLRTRRGPRRGGPSADTPGMDARLPLQPADQELALVDHFRRQVVVQVEEEFLVADDLAAPGVAIDLLEFLELLLRKVEADPVDVLVVRLPTDGRFLGRGAAAGTLHDPF